MSTMAAMLDDRAVLAVTGADAQDFLQGLITNDIEQCKPGQPIYAGLLTPQGKLLFDFFVIAADDGYLIDCAATQRAALEKRLTMYRLRAKVTLSARDDLAVAAVWGTDAVTHETPLQGLLHHADPRLAELGFRAVGSTATLSQALMGTGAELVPDAAYHQHRLKLGVPDSADMPPESLFALDADFDELHGVSFKKGCYVGQEVTARMKHRAADRKRMIIAETDDTIPPPGTIIEAQNTEIGRFATGRDKRALALVRLDKLESAEAGGTPITTPSMAVRLLRPTWMQRS
jgi:folate-binding protein YgfZ